MWLRSIISGLKSFPYQRMHLSIVFIYIYHVLSNDIHSSVVSNRAFGPIIRRQKWVISNDLVMWPWDHVPLEIMFIHPFKLWILIWNKASQPWKLNQLTQVKIKQSSLDTSSKKFIMVFVKEDSARNYGLQKELIFLFFPVAFMLILLVRKYLIKSKVNGQSDSVANINRSWSLIHDDL